MKALRIILTLAIGFASSFMIASAIEMPQYHLHMFGASVLASAFLPVGVFQIIDVSSITFNGEEIRSLREAIMNAVFGKPELNSIHTMVPDIIHKKQIVLLGLKGLQGIKDPGCDPDSSTSSIPISEKFWDPEGIFNRDEECYTNLEASFFNWGLKKGVEKPDLTGTDFANFLIERTDDAVLESIWRIAWFGDRDISDTTASPPGTLNDPLKVKFFDQIDGFFKQLFIITAANPKQRVEIPENALGTEVAQLDLDSERAINVLRDLVQNADKRLKGHKDKVYYITDTLNDNLTTFLESQNVNSSFERIEKGTGGKISFRGIPIEVIDVWDRNIQEHFDDGTKLFKPHRAVLTVKSNIQIGMEDSTAFEQLKPFFNERLKKFFIDSLFKMDAKIPEDFLVMFAH